MKRKTVINAYSALIGITLGITVSVYAAENRTRAAISIPDVVKDTESVEEIPTPIVHITPPIQLHMYEPVTEAPTEAPTEAVTEAPFVGYEFIPFDSDMQLAILNLCNEYNMCFDLVMAVIRTETRFKWLIGDNGNSVGYMQIQPRWWQKTADAYGLNIYDPLDNIHLGIIILDKAIRGNGGDLIKALKQYNSGNPNSKNMTYVEKIYENLEWIELQNGAPLELCIEGRCGNGIYR